MGSTPEERKGCLLRISLKFFSNYRDLIGVREMTLTLQDGSTLQNLWEALVGRYPNLTAHTKTAVMAVNRDFAKQTTRLKDGDEVAIMPPIGGG